MNAVAATGLFNLEAEQALLGALLNRPDEALAVGLSPGAFYEGAHQSIFAEILKAVSEDQQARPEVIAGRLKADSALAELGGLGFLLDLIDKAPPATAIPQLEREIADRWTRRMMLEAAREIAHEATTNLAAPADDVLLQAERILAAINADDGRSSSAITAAEALDLGLRHAERFGSVPEFQTGIADLDDKLSFQRGELTILAGRPGSGKTLVGLNFARHLASRGAGIFYASLEMAAAPLGLRLGCDQAFIRGGFGRPWGGPTMHAVAKGLASRDDLSLLAEAGRALAASTLKLDCRPALTLSQIEQAARRQLRDWRKDGIEPGPIFVDHLGLVRPEKDRRGNRHSEVADVSRGLAELAKRLDLPVIALCQLNRGVEGREDKRPVLSDLRQAGELEEDARVVLLLHRPAYYFRAPEHGETFEQEAERLVKEERERDLLRFIIAKNSNGPTGEVEAYVDVMRSALRDRETVR